MFHRSIRAFSSKIAIVSVSFCWFSTRLLSLHHQSSIDAPKAIGPYSQAIKANGFVFVSGQLGVDPKTNDFAGPDVSSQSQMVFKNIAAVLKAAGCTMNDVVKTTVLLADMKDYVTVNGLVLFSRLFLSSVFWLWVLFRNLRST